MNEELYLDNLTHEGFSVFSGGQRTAGICHKDDVPKSAILKAFLEDDDIQEITVTSTNIGFSRTWRKQYRPKAGSGL